MRTEKGFRFSLQFPAGTAEQQQVGEFLERIGSKKSSVVVQALTDYLQKYPDLLEAGGTIQVAAAGISMEDVRVLIRDELARSMYTPSSEKTNANGDDQENMVADVLNNIGLFG